MDFRCRLTLLAWQLSRAHMFSSRQSEEFIPVEWVNVGAVSFLMLPLKSDNRLKIIWPENLH